jgi:hypothetical protein
MKREAHVNMLAAGNGGFIVRLVEGPGPATKKSRKIWETSAGTSNIRAKLSEAAKRRMNFIKRGRP